MSRINLLKMKKITKNKIKKRVNIYLQTKLGRRFSSYKGDDLITVYKHIKKKDSDFYCRCFYCTGEKGYRRKPKTKNVFQILNNIE